MKIRYIIIGVVLIPLILIIDNFKLAHSHSGEDRLVGMLLSEKFLSEFEENKNKPPQIYEGRSIEEAIEKSLVDSPKIEATLVTEKLSSDDGKTIENSEYQFLQKEVLAYFYYNTKQDEENGLTISSSVEKNTSDLQVYVKSSDKAKEVQLEGEVLFSLDKNSKEEFLYNIAYIYRRADGSIYASDGQSFYTPMNHVGDNWGHQIAETFNQSFSGQMKVEDKISINLKTKVVYAPKQIKILQMDKNNKVIRQAEYPPQEMPEKIIPDSDTKYIIVESIAQDRDNKSVSSYEVYEKNEEMIQTYFGKESGVCEKVNTPIKWQVK